MPSKRNELRPHYTLRQLARMCRSPKAAVRMKAVDAMQYQSDMPPPRGYFRLAAGLLDDRVSKIRWQSAILLGDFLPTMHAEIWKLCLGRGASSNEDVRAMVACVLLEHLFEHHFDRYFPLVAAKVRGGRNFEDTVSTCWRFRVPARKWRKMTRLLKR